MTNQLSLEKREVAGKQLKALRAAGQIPSVVYGGEVPMLTTSAYNPTEKALMTVGYHSPLELTVAGQPKSQLAIVKRVDLDPVSRRIINIEFQAIAADEVVEATTPIRLVDFESSDAAKKHYVLLQVLEEVEIKAHPSDLPDEIIVSAAKLAELTDRLTLQDLQLPANVTLANKELGIETVVANVYDPAAEAAAREAEAATEPVGSTADDAGSAAPAAE